LIPALFSGPAKRGQSGNSRNYCPIGVFIITVFRQSLVELQLDNRQVDSKIQQSSEIAHEGEKVNE
jgi:hypothetical protein